MLDPSLIQIAKVTDGLKDDGIIIINTKKTPEAIKKEFGFNWRIATIDAMKIARETLGVPIVNTTMIGTLIKATSLVEVDSIIDPINARFGRLADKNIKAMKKAYEETIVKELS